MGYTVYRTPQATLRRLAQMAAVAHQPASPPPQRMRTRDQRAADARTADAYERACTGYQIRCMNDAARRFWRDAAPSKGLMAGSHSEPPPSAFPTPRYGSDNGGNHNVRATYESALEGARGGSDTMALAHGGDPVPDLSRKPAMGAPSQDLPLCSQNAVNHHHWSLSPEKRSDFLAAVRGAHVNGQDVSPAAIAKIAAMFA
jgi:hypothetical protein